MRIIICCIFVLRKSLGHAVVEYMSTGGAMQCLSLFNPTPTKFGVKETIKVIRQPVLQFEMASVFG